MYLTLEVNTKLGRTGHKRTQIFRNKPEPLNSFQSPQDDGEKSSTRPIDGTADVDQVKFLALHFKTAEFRQNFYL